MLVHSSPGLDSGPLGGPLFRRCTALSAARSPPLAQTWHSKIAIRDQYRKGGQFSPSSASLVTPISTKPRQPRGKFHPSLQCHNWPDWVADGTVWSDPVSAGNPETQVGTCLMAHTGEFRYFCYQIDWSEAVGSIIYIDLINRSIFEIMSLWSFSTISVRWDQASRGRSVLPSAPDPSCWCS